MQKVFHRFLGSQPKTKDVSRLAVNDHVHGWRSNLSLCSHHVNRSNTRRSISGTMGITACKDTRGGGGVMRKTSGLGRSNTKCRATRSQGGRATASTDQRLRRVVVRGMSSRHTATPLRLIRQSQRNIPLRSKGFKPAVEGLRTTAGVEARSVIGQQTAEKVIHRRFGGQPEPEDLPALAVNDHVHGSHCGAY
jgi:hypothetical protein